MVRHARGRVDPKSMRARTSVVGVIGEVLITASVFDSWQPTSAGPPACLYWVFPWLNTFVDETDVTVGG